MCSTPCLAFPDKSKTFILDTDASDYAIGAVLSQIHDGEEQVIAYGSKRMSNSEQHYCITRKELMSVYHFVKYFKHYLLGKRFIIRTDHKSLKWLLDWDRPNTSQYCSWVAELQNFDFQIRHRSGASHINADFMSRPIECQQCNIPHTEPKNKKNVKIYRLTEQNTEETVSRKGRSKVKRCHNDLGHIGCTKLKEVFKHSNLHWEKIEKDIEDVVANCLYCQERKGKGKHVTKDMKIIASEPLDNIMIDIAGPLTKTKAGNQFILSIIDVFSRFIMLIPLKQISSHLIIQAILKKWVPFCGYPEYIQSDCGTNFTSKEMSKFCLQHNICQKFSSPYHPQSNGIVERYFRTVKDMIYATAKDNGKDWDEVLTSVELGLRSTPNRITGHSPFEVLFGKIPRVVPWKISSARDRVERRQKIQMSIKNMNQAEQKKNENIKS